MAFFRKTVTPGEGRFESRQIPISRDLLARADGTKKPPRRAQIYAILKQNSGFAQSGSAAANGDMVRPSDAVKAPAKTILNERLTPLL